MTQGFKFHFYISYLFVWLLLTNSDLTVLGFWGVFIPVSWPSVLFGSSVVLDLPIFTWKQLVTHKAIISYISLWCFCLVAKSCSTTATWWTVAHQDPLSKRFSRQEASILEWVAISFSRVWCLSKALKMSSEDICTLRKDRLFEIKLAVDGGGVQSLSRARLLVTHGLQPSFSVPHHLPEFAQVHVHWISDAVQPSHPLPPPSLLALLFSSCPQSFPGSGAFLVSQLFASGAQSIEASASASVLPVNIQDWSPLGLTGLISLLSRVL